MRKKDFIGKQLGVLKIDKKDTPITFEKDMYDYPSLEVFLSDFACDGPTDR